PALPELLGLILARQSPCPEASFWLALAHLRRGATADGLAALMAAHDATGGRQVDTGLYLGALWLRAGQPRDALRVLSDANRLAPACPLVAWQLGVALTAAGGDVLLALRAFQKATAPDGLPKYLRSPHKLWAESWVRNLAQRATARQVRFRCPLGLDRMEVVLRDARLALAEALVTCDRAEEAVPVFAELVKTYDVLPIRRG